MANKKFIQKARNKMKRKGTVGAFTEYCGGRVTQACIDKAKRSDDMTLRRRAVFAENMRNLGSRKKKAQDGLLQIPGIQPAAIEQNIAAPQLQVPGASVAEGVKTGLNLGKTFQDAGMTLAGKGQDLLKGIKGGKVSVSAATDLLAAGAEKLINKKSTTASDALRNDKRERTGAAVGGAVKGAGRGFDIGNKIIPGLGGAIGAGIGAIGGAFGGKNKKEKERLSAVADLRKKQAAETPGILASQAQFTARAGGMKLPGGQMVPLPDGGKLYKGRKHESGGIDLKRDNIEVEGGETERKIVAADGNPIDYIFSEHHKVGKKIQAKYGVGKNTSYADIHRKMEEGGISKNYQELAKDQEDDMKRKGKNKYGPRGSKYIKRSGGLKEGIAKIKAQDGTSPDYMSPNYKGTRTDAQAKEYMQSIMRNTAMGSGISPGIDTSKIPEKKDKLYNMSEAEMRRNESREMKRQTDENLESLKKKGKAVSEYIKDNPVDALQVGLGGVAIGAEAIPFVGTGVSAGADLINAGISGYRAKKYAEKGNTNKAAFYSGLAALDTAAATPGIGNVAGASKIGMLLKNVGKSKIAHGAHTTAKLITKGKATELGKDALLASSKSKPSAKKKAQSAETNALQFNPPSLSLTTPTLGITTRVPELPAEEEQPVVQTSANEEAQETTPPAPSNQSRPKFDVFANKEEGDAFRQWLNTNMPEDAQRLDLDPSGSHTNAYIRRAWGEFGDDFTSSQQEGAQEQQEATQDTSKSVIDQIGEANTAEDVANIEGAEKVEGKTEEKVEEVVDEIKANTPGDSESTVEETTALRQNIRDLKKANRAVPPEALAAMAAQAVAPIYALTQKPPRVGGYAPQSYQAPKLGRVSGRADKDRVDQNMTALLASMEGQAMGPAAAANYANLLNQAQQQKGQIDQRTQQANMQLAAREAMMQTQASQFNIQQNQRAQEYMRNLALMQNQEEFANKFGALQALGQGVAGSLGDVMAYKSGERIARINVADTLDKEGRTALERADIRAIEKRREMSERMQEAKANEKQAKKNQKALDKAKKAGFDTVEEYEAHLAEKEAEKAAAKQALKDARKQKRSGGYIARSGMIRRTKR